MVGKVIRSKFSSPVWISPFWLLEQRAGEQKKTYKDKEASIPPTSCPTPWSRKTDPDSSF